MISIRLFIPILVQVRISSGVRIARSDCCVCSFFLQIIVCPFVLLSYGHWVVCPYYYPFGITTTYLKKNTADDEPMQFVVLCIFADVCLNYIKYIKLFFNSITKELYIKCNSLQIYIPLVSLNFLIHGNLYLHSNLQTSTRTETRWAQLWASVYKWY